MKKLLLILFCLPMIGFGQGILKVPIRKENQTFIDWHTSSEYKSFVNQASIWINQSEDDDLLKKSQMIDRLEVLNEIYMVLKEEQEDINELNKLRSYSLKKKYDDNEPLPKMLIRQIESKNSRMNRYYRDKGSNSTYSSDPNDVLKDMKKKGLLCDHKNCFFSTNDYDSFEDVRT